MRNFPPRAQLGTILLRARIGSILWQVRDMPVPPSMSQLCELTRKELTKVGNPYDLQDGGNGRPPSRGPADPEP